MAKNKEADPAQVCRAYMTRSATELRSKPIALQVMAQALLGPAKLAMAEGPAGLRRILK